MNTLNDIDNWQATAVQHWHPLIDQILNNVADQPWQPPYDPSDDQAALKAELATHLTTLATAVTQYRASHPGRSVWIDALLSLLFYIQLAKVAPANPAPVPSPVSLADDDLRQLFAWWTQPLPVPAALFVIHYNGSPDLPVYAPLAEPPVVQVTGRFSLATTAAFSTAIDAIQSAANSDLDRLQNLPSQIHAVTRERVAYGVFAGADADIKPTDLDAKPHLLDTMHAQTILDTFGWTIKGLNA